MMYPDPSNHLQPAFYLCIDFKKPELLKEVNLACVPTTWRNCKSFRKNMIWYGRIEEVDCNARNANLRWYTETRRQGVCPTNMTMSISSQY